MDRTTDGTLNAKYSCHHKCYEKQKVLCCHDGICNDFWGHFRMINTVKRIRCCYGTFCPVKQ